MTDKYDIIIGLEIHIQTKTKSGMFCSCSADYFGKEPNTHVCPVCLGLPGALPLPNKVAIQKCILLGLATECDIDKELRFDRKHYFYPDLPKGYQISQYDQPLCSDGKLTISLDGEEKIIEIERIHQEEDVAKSTHHSDENGEYSLIDYNKSGAPLIEVVTKPVIGSAAEAKAFASEIRRVVRYLDISNADMEKGQMRCEPNISVQEKGAWEYKDGKILPKKGKKLNPKVEVKNIGSISAVEKSIEYEIKRLIGEIEEGNEIIQQTRGWSPSTNTTEFQRSKETAEDYRYFPEPDIPAITITPEDIKGIGKALVELPLEREKRYVAELELSEYDSAVITADKVVTKYFDRLLAETSNHIDSEKEAAGAVAKILTGVMFALTKDLEVSPYDLDISALAELIGMLNRKIVNAKKVNDLITEAVKDGKNLKKLLDETDTDVVSDTGALTEIAQKIILDNPKSVADYKGGKKTAIKHLLGQVMKETKGNAQPNIASALLLELLNERNENI